MSAIFRYFVYGSWWVSLCASVLALLTWYELTSTWWNTPLFVFIFGSTLVVYNLNMLSGLDELRHVGTDSERHHWCIRNERLMKMTFAFGLVLASISIWFLHSDVWLFMVPLSAVALTYTLPVLRKRSSRIRLREVGLWKIFIIAVVWAGMTVILPAVHLQGWHQITDPNSWQLGIERGIFILAITIPFDIRDLENDAKKGVATIPSTVGTFRSLLLAIVLLLLHAFLMWMRLGFEHPLFQAHLISTLITILAISYATPNRNDMYCSFWIEGTMMLQFVVAFALL